MVKIPLCPQKALKKEGKSGKRGKNNKKSQQERGDFAHHFRIVRKFAPWCEISYTVPLSFLFCSCFAPVLLICRASFDSDSLCLVDSANLALKGCKNYKKSQNAIRIIIGTLMCKSG